MTIGWLSVAVLAAQTLLAIGCTSDWNCSADELCLAASVSDQLSCVSKKSLTQECLADEQCKPRDSTCLRIDGEHSPGVCVCNALFKSVNSTCLYRFCDSDRDCLHPKFNKCKLNRCEYAADISKRTRGFREYNKFIFYVFVVSLLIWLVPVAIVSFALIYECFNCVRLMTTRG